VVAFADAPDSARHGLSSGNVAADTKWLGWLRGTGFTRCYVAVRFLSFGAPPMGAVFPLIPAVDVCAMVPTEYVMRMAWRAASTLPPPILGVASANGSTPNAEAVAALCAMLAQRDECAALSCASGFDLFLCPANAASHALLADALLPDLPAGSLLAIAFRSSAASNVMGGPSATCALPVSGYSAAAARRELFSAPPPPTRVLEEEQRHLVRGIFRHAAQATRFSAGDSLSDAPLRVRGTAAASDVHTVGGVMPLPAGERRRRRSRSRTRSPTRSYSRSRSRTLSPVLDATSFLSRHEEHEWFERGDDGGAAAREEPHSPARWAEAEERRDHLPEKHTPDFTEGRVELGEAAFASLSAKTSTAATATFGELARRHGVRITMGPRPPAGAHAGAHMTLGWLRQRLLHAHARYTLADAHILHSSPRRSAMHSAGWQPQCCGGCHAQLAGHDAAA
jgi:hypothetical protein